MTSKNDSGFSLYELSVSLVITGILITTLSWSLNQLLTYHIKWQETTMSNQEELSFRSSIQNILEASYQIQYNANLQSLNVKSFNSNQIIIFKPILRINQINFPKTTIESIKFDTINFPKHNMLSLFFFNSKINDEPLTLYLPKSKSNVSENDKLPTN